MNLHFDNTAFRELVELTADHFGFEYSHVEKDYWICKILKELTNSEFQLNIFFKGGTSLSKAYGIIDRFRRSGFICVFRGPAVFKTSRKNTQPSCFSFYNREQ